MNYHNVTYDDMKNGDGLRVVLWVSGCDHYCPGCQNPVTWDPNDGLIFDENTARELRIWLEKDYIDGLTLSGGDPLYKENRAIITTLCKSVKEAFPEKTIWLYTGYCYEDVKDLPVMDSIDILVDGPYVEKLRDVNLRWRGSSNQRVIDVQKTRELGKIVLWCE